VAMVVFGIGSEPSNADASMAALRGSATSARMRSPVRLSECNGLSARFERRQSFQGVAELLIGANVITRRTALAGTMTRSLLGSANHVGVRYDVKSRRMVGLVQLRW
jgi:hypothetical protein